MQKPYKASIWSSLTTKGVIFVALPDLRSDTAGRGWQSPFFKILHAEACYMCDCRAWAPHGCTLSLFILNWSIVLGVRGLRGPQSVFSVGVISKAWSLYRGGRRGGEQPHSQGYPHPTQLKREKSREQGCGRGWGMGGCLASTPQILK